MTDKGDDRGIVADGDVFRFAGRTLDELVAIAGGTPVYLYDRAVIDASVARLRGDLPSDVRLHYSLKANPLAALVDHVSRLVDGLDITSHGELRTALGARADAKRISFSGPGKRDTELLAAVTAGVTIHLESAGELERVAAIAERTGCTPRLSVRVNPDFAIKQSGMVMGGGPQPFGIDREEIAAAIARLRELGLACDGLHCYAGSQMLSADVVADVQSRTLDMMVAIVRETRLDRVALNIGGGFGIPYFPKDTALDTRAVGEALAARLDRLASEIDVGEVALELGRHLVGEAGVYVARVVERKASRGERYLVLDGGLNHHLAATGNLGQVIRRNYPLVGSRAIDEAGAERTSVVGPLCTPLDVLAKDVRLPELEPGDLVAVLQSGAYGRSASPHGFLGHPPPLELLI